MYGTSTPNQNLTRSEFQYFTIYISLDHPNHFGPDLGLIGDVGVDYFTDEIANFLNWTFRLYYATYMFQIYQDCRVNINAWSFVRIPAENLQIMKIIEYY